MLTFGPAELAAEENRQRVLHLTCCLLPKSHRDSLEILFSFLVWASSFSQVDEESGSKMDTHNLATVIAPNILKEKPTANVNMDDSSFLAIEAVHCLIEFNDQMCEVGSILLSIRQIFTHRHSQVPEDLQSILNDSSLFNKSSDLTTKEILQRYGDIGKEATRRPVVTEQNADSPPPRSRGSNNAPSSAKAAAPVITHVDTDPYQSPVWSQDSSVRHVQGQAQGAPTYPTTSNNTPPQQFDFSNPASAYHRRGGSSESQASNRSAGGAAHGRGHSGWAKPGAGRPTGVPG